MQTKEFDYDSVPQGFAHCLNEQCPQSADCLRRKAALHIPTDCQFIKIVNPTNTPKRNPKSQISSPKNNLTFPPNERGKTRGSLSPLQKKTRESYSLPR